MRLIDADKIHWEYKCISKEEIDDEPTVQAIPIERLKRYELAKGQEVRLQDAINEWEKENGK